MPSYKAFDSKEVKKIKRNERKWVRETGVQFFKLKEGMSLKRDYMSGQVKSGKCEKLNNFAT